METQGDRLALIRAKRALILAKLPGGDSLARASSTRNEVFLSPEHVIRVNKQPSHRLRREAALCRSLPNYSWTPKVVAYGGDVGADFLIVKRQTGVNLSTAWPQMDAKMRRRAIRFLAGGMRALHEMKTPINIPPIDQAPHLFDGSAVTPIVPMLVAIDDLKRIEGVDKFMLSDLQVLIHELGASLPTFSRRTLIHGDLSFENVLWDGQQVTAFVDFEWCRGAPPDLDLDVLLRFCAFPQAHVPEALSRITRPEDFSNVPQWLMEDLPELFDHERMYDRLRLFAFSYDLRELALDPRPPNGRGGPLHPYNRIRSMMNSGGYLHNLLAPTDMRV